jgi:hypothetical protein
VQGALRKLRAQGLELTLVDAHTRRPHAVLSPLADADGQVLVGGPRAASAFAAGRLRVGSLTPVEVLEGADVAVLLGERVPLHG